MGGTSCDVALIKDGEPFVASRGKIEGRDIAVPMMDINTVSAGGGTHRPRRPLRRAAGRARRAPARCRGRPATAAAATMPTITDCNLVLGLSRARTISSAARCGSTPPRRCAAVESKIAQPLGMGVQEAAEGIVRIIDVKMEEAIKAISTMRGHDLRDFMLLAFGGAGPVHAGRIARDLGMAGVIVPLYPGVYSAIGLLMSDVKHDYIQSQHDAARASSRPRTSTRMFARLEAQAAEELRDDGFAADADRASSARSTCAMPARATRSRCRAATRR